MVIRKPFSEVIGFVADLMFQVKIEAAAGRGSYPIRWVASQDDLTIVSKISAERYQPDWADDADALLIDRLSDWLPVLVIFDLGNEAIPSLRWIGLLKSSPATRRIPLVCYGSHVAADILRSARKTGADAVLARSGFAADPGALIVKYAHIPAHAQLDLLASTCHADLSQPARRGLELFNQGLFFEAHELLEEAWKESPSPGKELYRAILQISVAYLQLERQNYLGAVKMFWRSRQWINPLPDECQGINVARLRADAQAVYLALTALGADRLEAFDWQLLKPVEYC